MEDDYVDEVDGPLFDNNQLRSRSHSSNTSDSNDAADRIPVHRQPGESGFSDEEGHVERVHLDLDVDVVNGPSEASVEHNAQNEYDRNALQRQRDAIRTMIAGIEEDEERNDEVVSENEEHENDDDDSSEEGDGMDMETEDETAEEEDIQINEPVRYGLDVQMMPADEFRDFRSPGNGLLQVRLTIFALIELFSDPQWNVE
jgi:hypothetical protein